MRMTRLRASQDPSAVHHRIIRLIDGQFPLDDIGREKPAASVPESLDALRRGTPPRASYLPTV